MILFFVRGEVDSDKFIRFCYMNYRNLMSDVDDLPKRVEILREDGKKPRLDAPNVHFNLSHSHGASMLGMSHSPIGVDIELLRPVRREKFDFISANDDREFFEEWTRRESYVKFTGEGIAKIRAEIPADAHFEQFDVFDGYIASVCAEEQNIVAYELDPAAIDDFEDM